MFYASRETGGEGGVVWRMRGFHKKNVMILIKLKIGLIKLIPVIFSKK